MGRAKLKARAAQRYVPAVAQVETERAVRRTPALEFLPLELPQGVQRQEAVAASPKKTQPCLVEAPTHSECWSQPPVVDTNSKREAVEGKEEVAQLDGDDLGGDDSAQYVCCLPRVTQRRTDGVAVDVMAAALAGGGQSGAKASLHVRGRRVIDPLRPVLYMDVHGGRIRLEGRLLTTRSAHISTLSISKGVKGEESEVRLRDRLPGVVVFHRLEWLGSVDDNPTEEVRAFPNSIEVELPFDEQEGNFASDTSEQLAGDMAEPPRKRQRYEGDSHQAKRGADASNNKPQVQTATVYSGGEQFSLETPAEAEVDFASDEPVGSRLLSPLKEAAETTISQSQGTAHILDRTATPASTPLKSSEHNGQREKAATQPTNVDEPLHEWVFSQSDAVDSESESSSSRSPSPARTRRTGKRRHKFGTNDSDEDPDWTESVDPTSAVESEIESELSSSASRSSASAELPMPKAKRRRKKRRRRREDAPPPSTGRETTPRPPKGPMPSASANNTAAAKRRQELRPSPHNHDDEIIVLDDDSDDEGDEDDEDDEARHQPRKDSRRGAAAPPSESDDSIELLGVVEALMTNRTPSGPASQSKGGRGASQWFAKPKVSVENEGDEDDDKAIARPRRRAARKRPRVLDSNEEQQENQRSSGGGSRSDDDDELVNQVLSTPRRAIG